jgi:hypothetical protein
MPLELIKSIQIANLTGKNQLANMARASEKRRRSQPLGKGFKINLQVNL